jgi:hypothetical protein
LQALKIVDRCLHETTSAANSTQLLHIIDQWMNHQWQLLCASVVSDRQLHQHRSLSTAAQLRCSPLIEWLESSTNADLSKVKVVETAIGGFGLVATRPIAAREAVLSVPASTLFSLKNLQRHQQWSRVLTTLRETIADESLELLCCIALHRRWTRDDNDHHWQLYFRSLPTVADMQTTSPFLFNDEQLLGEFRGTPLLDEVLQRRAELQEAFEQVSRALESIASDERLPSLTFEDFLWARCIVDSRAFFVRQAAADDSQPQQLALVPFVDFLNHHANGQVSMARLDERKETFALHALVDIAAGQQLFFSYGEYSNRELLLYYGFAEPSNELGVVEIGLDLPPPLEQQQQSQSPDPNELLRRALFDRHALSQFDRHLIRLANPLPRKLLATVRLLVATPTTLQQLNKSKGDRTPFAMIDHQNESESLSVLRDAFRSTLEEIEDSSTTTTTMATTTAMSSAQVYRYSSIRVLRKALEMIDEKLNLVITTTNGQRQQPKRAPQSRKKKKK